MRGYEQVKSKLSNLADKGPLAAVNSGINEVAEAIYSESQQVVNVDTGALKTSGKLDRTWTGKKVTVVISYNTDYAMYVHERFNKYLSQPFDSHKGELEAKVNASIRSLL
jgi:hypothetical protein